jgi:hypothetical protein
VRLDSDRIQELTAPATIGAPQHLGVCGPERDSEGAGTSMTASLRVAICGAIGGATNAWLCYAQLPVPAGGPGTSPFAWHVVPAGAVHGFVLAVVAFGASGLFSNRSVGVRLLAAPLLTWIAGMASWIPLNRSAFEESWAKSLTWPFHEGLPKALVAPLQYFGLVAGFYYFSLVFGRPRQRRLHAHLFSAFASAALGSLWWWISVEPWYFSVLHGAIWGSFVGAGVWSVTRRPAIMETSVA